MATWFAKPQLARDDRYVRHCRLRGCGQMSREQMAFLLEDALRLASLPGENEGRVYFFRKVSVRNLSARASRQAWTNAVGLALLDLAARAIHVSDDRAHSAEAVFFYNYQEALQLLLARILQREPLNCWFWPLVAGTAVEVTRSERVLAIVERLRELPASWLAVAESVLAAIGYGDPLTLLSLLPLATVNSWLRELAPRQVISARSRPVPLPQTFHVILQRSLRTIGGNDPRVVWLASLAVLCVLPSELSTGMVVNRAQCTLQSLTGKRAADTPDVANSESLAGQVAPSSQYSRLFDALSLPQNAVELRQPPLHQRIEFGEAVAESTAGKAPIVTSAVTATNQTARQESSHRKQSSSQAAKPLPPVAIHFEEVGEPNSSIVLPEDGGVQSNGILLGAPTSAAGLYFLLNALRLLGIAEALRSNPIAAESGLVARIVQRLAAYAGIEAGDPILHWIDLSLGQIQDLHIPLEDATVTDCSTLFPSNLRPSSRSLFDAEYFSRVWSIAVRRWCWRVGGFTARQVVNRSGLVSMNRSDLDVTLSLDSADIRIRRLGLDIDPGWLPWFGKVVRFHYVWDEGIHGH